MTIQAFKLEEYLTRYEFSSPYLLCCSDSESFSMQELLTLASEEDQHLWDNLRLSYTEPYGAPALREQIVKSLYPTLNPDNILCFSGAEEGIYASLQVLCEPRDHVIVLTPCYQSLLEIPRSRGAEVTTLELKEKNDWRIDLTAIQNAIKPNTKVIVINFPHNPTGQVISQDEMNDLVTLCNTHGLWLFSDEVYRLLGQPLTPWCQTAAELYPRAISLGVMSKAFGMPGLRVGWIACQNTEMLHKIKLLKDYLSICNSAPAEILSLIGLKNMDKILARNNKIVTRNLSLLDAFFNEFKEQFSWVRPQGGCVGFVSYEGGETSDKFCQSVLETKGVLLLPSTVYDYPSTHFRIGFGRDNMPIALAKLKEFLVD